jgi:hypothetical protein
MSTIGSIVGIAKGVTDLQRSKVALEQDTGALEARKAVAQAAMDPENMNEDGTLNLDKFSIAALRADPKNYVATDFIGKAAHSNNQLTQLKSAALGLGDQVQGYLGQRIGALSLDPNVTKADVATALDDAIRIAGPGATAASKLRDITLERLKLVKDEDLPKALIALRNRAFPIASQAPQTALVNTGAQTVPVQSNPLAGPVGPMGGAATVPNQVGPAQAEQVTQDLLGNPMKVITAPDGRKSFQPVEGAKTPPLLAFPPGESQQTAAKLAEARQASNDAARSVAEQRANNREIIKLTDGAITGAGSDKLNSVLTSAGLQGLTGDTGTDYNLIGHYLSMQAQNNAKMMGAGTDASRGISEQVAGSRTWTADALKKATKVNDALAAGVGYFNDGLEKAINDPNNQKSIFAARDYQNAWAKNMDVRALRLLNAVEAGDKGERAAILKEIGGEGSPAAKALAAKVRVLGNLVETGRP